MRVGRRSGVVEEASDPAAGIRTCDAGAVNAIARKKREQRGQKNCKLQISNCKLTGVEAHAAGAARPM